MSYHLESISPEYYIIALIIITIGQVVEKTFAKGKREKIALIQRELYYQRLKEEANEMDKKIAAKEQELMENIEQLGRESELLRSELDDWSGADDEEEEESSTSELEQELASLQESAGELETVEKSIEQLSEQVDHSITREELEAQVNDCNTYQISSLTSKSELDPEILKYLENHSEELTLDFLKTAHETLIELKALHPGRNFDDYINDLKMSQKNYSTELAELQVSKKEYEIKLELWKKRYDEELKSFDELRVDHIFKNSGAKEYLSRIREKNKMKEDMITELRVELDNKKKELAIWQKKFHEAEEQCNVYWKAWKDTSTKLEQMELDKKAAQEQERRFLNRSMNMSSPSSLLAMQVPPPPPIEVPSIDEILRSTLNQDSHFSLEGNITPPPPVEVPYSSLKFN